MNNYYGKTEFISYSTLLFLQSRKNMCYGCLNSTFKLDNHQGVNGCLDGLPDLVSDDDKYRNSYGSQNFVSKNDIIKGVEFFNRDSYRSQNLLSKNNTNNGVGFFDDRKYLYNKNNKNIHRDSYGLQNSMSKNNTNYKKKFD